MNLKVLFLIMGYYSILSILIIMLLALVPGFDGTSTVDIHNVTGNVTATEFPDVGLFSIGYSVLRFFGILLFGIGFPSDTPLIIVIGFAIWQTLVSVMSIGFLFSSAWDG